MQANRIVPNRIYHGGEHFNLEIEAGRTIITITYEYEPKREGQFLIGAWGNSLDEALQSMKIQLVELMEH